MNLEKFLTGLKELIEAFLKYVKGENKKPKVDYNRNKACLQFASMEIGQKEVVGSGNNKQVVKYHVYARKDNDPKKGLADSVPWCASFICYILEANPYIKMGSTNSMQARSFLKWGVSSKKRPLPGDIVVFWRESIDSWQGHAGFYLDETDQYIYVLGGNQDDSVNISKYSKSKLLDIRRSSKAKEYNEVEEDQLFDMGEALIKGRKISADGKVH